MVGFWDWDKAQLPRYEYMGGYPFVAKDKTGKDSMIPDDPCFILGNYKMTVFVHASGMYELISGERGWARLNHGGKNVGWNQSILCVTDSQQNTKEYELVGNLADTGITVKQYFGIGYVEHHYDCPQNLKLTKTFWAKPSIEVNKGNASILVDVAFKNEGEETISVNYGEQLLVNYRMMTHQDEEAESDNGRLVYKNQLKTNQDQMLLTADVICEPIRVLVLPKDSKQNYTYDCFPPTVFMKIIGEKDSSTKVETSKNKHGDLLCASYIAKLAPGEEKKVRLVIGYSFEGEEGDICKQINDMLEQGDFEDVVERYTSLWHQKLPDFSNEKNEEIRCEMYWNAYVLECMATYNQYFEETYIPQGSVYAYHLGQNASNRDHLQHLLPMIYANPKLAKSCLRFVMKHTLESGEITRQDIGYGYCDPNIYMESDEQIYVIMAVGEYLRITGDYEFLNEDICYYPVEHNRKNKVLNVLMQHFVYLRDTVGCGQHGLVKMLNSDWSDSFFHPYSPNIYMLFAESHLNTAMVLAMIPNYVSALKKAKESLNIDRLLMDGFINELKEYRQVVYNAFMKDMEDKVFSPRCYIGEHDEPELKFGVHTLCLEPQPFLLQMSDFPVERKRKLCQEIKDKVLNMEKVGARTRAVPLWDKGAHGEDGGIWFAHQGPLMVGMSTFDKKEAKRLFCKLLFHRYADNYPQYWLGHWTFADSVESTLSDREGLYHFWIQQAYHPFCAHAHAWMLYCYYRIYCE